jgi:hypothetical protein
MKNNGLQKIDPFALLEAKGKRRDEREERALACRNALEAEFRSVNGVSPGAPIAASDQALLAVASSALLEVELTTARLVAGRARSKALKNLGFARSELRRCLRSLGLIANDGESVTNGDAAPPPGATDAEKVAWSRRYVDGVLAEKSVAS